MKVDLRVTFFADRDSIFWSVRSAVRDEYDMVPATMAFASAARTTGARPEYSYPFVFLALERSPPKL